MGGYWQAEDVAREGVCVFVCTRSFQHGVWSLIRMWVCMGTVHLERERERCTERYRVCALCAHVCACIYQAGVVDRNNSPQAVSGCFG